MKLRHVGVLCLLSFVLGAALIPANAGSEGKLERRLKKAEKRLVALADDLAQANTLLQQTAGRVTSAEGRLTTAESKIASAESKISAYSTRLLNAESDISDIEDDTWQLDYLGNYTGPIRAAQVDAPFFCEGEAALWRDIPYSDLNC